MKEEITELISQYVDLPKELRESLVKRILEVIKTN